MNKEKPIKLETEEKALANVAGGGNALTCSRCGRRISVVVWRDNGGYCASCRRKHQEELTKSK